MKKIIYTFLIFLLVSNSIFIVNFLWTHYSGIPLFGTYEKTINIGNSLYKQEQYKLSLPLYQTASQDFPNSFEAFHNLGNTHYRAGDLAAAIESYESALELQSDPETQKNLEFVQSELKQQESPQEEEKDNDSQEQNPHPPEDTSPGQDEENKDGGEQQELSQQTKEILEERSQQLEQAQSEFKKYYNNNYKPDNSKNLLEKMFNNSLITPNEEKDW